MTASIRPISAAQTRPLRRSVLRPHQQEHELEYPGDDAPDALHLGAFIDGKLVGVASLYREDHTDFPIPGWRLRGMATAPEARGTGLGGKLILGCIGHAARAGGSSLWCNARVPSVGYYARYGFTKDGPAFELPQIGPHFLMVRPLTEQDRSLPAPSAA